MSIQTHSSGLYGGKYVRSTRFASIGAGTSGTVTLPFASSVILDDFGGTVDAVVVQISGGKPTKEPALTSLGVVVATTFDSSGNYVLSGAPAGYPVAIVYRVRQTLAVFDDTDADIWGDSEMQGEILTAGIYSMSSGAQSFSVNYAATVAAAVPPIVAVINTVDATPILLQVIVTAYSSTGFSFKINADTDSANYKLQYAVMAR